MVTFGEMFKIGWTKSKSNSKEQQYTSAFDGASVLFVQVRTEPRGEMLERLER